MPAGAGVGGNESWTWVTANPAPFSGTQAHQSALVSGLHQHYFVDYSARVVNTGDTLFAYVYLDPANPPTEVMLQWYDGTGWEHRAYWGANQIAFGADGTASRRSMGPLPATGQWVRLEVTAAQVNLEGSSVSGIAFALNGGRATWDRVGKAASGGTSNVAPTVNFTATPSSVTVGAAVALNAGASTDSDGTITNYSWNFGDGTSFPAAGVTNASATTSKTYRAAGT